MNKEERNVKKDREGEKYIWKKWKSLNGKEIKWRSNRRSIEEWGKRKVKEKWSKLLRSMKNKGKKKSKEPVWVKKKKMHFYESEKMFQK